MTTQSAKPLTPFEVWMVKSNLAHIKADKLDPKQVVATLRANGYFTVALAVEKLSVSSPQSEASAR